MKTTLTFPLGLGPDKEGCTSSTALRPAVRRRASWGPVEETTLVSKLVTACEEMRTTYPQFSIAGLRLPELLFGVKSGPWRNVVLRIDPGGKAVSIEEYIEHCVGDIESFFNRHPEFERMDTHDGNEKRWRLHVQFTEAEKSLLKEAMVLDLPSKRNFTPKRTRTFGRASRFKHFRIGTLASARNPRSKHKEGRRDVATARSTTTVVAGTPIDHRQPTATAPGFYSSQASVTPRRCESDVIVERNVKKPPKPTISQHLSSAAFHEFCERQAEHLKLKQDFSERTQRHIGAASGAAPSSARVPSSGHSESRRPRAASNHSEVRPGPARHGGYLMTV